MFWPVVLPAQITFWIFTAIVLISVIRSKTKKRVLITLFLGPFLSILLFIPSCTVVMHITDYFRFGVFHYPDFNSVNDFRIQRALPETATDITVEKRESCHFAKYSIAKEELKAWHEQNWKTQDSKFSRSQIETVLNEEISALCFEQVKWSIPLYSEYYHGPPWANGGGYSIFYSPSEQTAYEYCGYW